MARKTRGGGRRTAYGGEFTSAEQKRQLAQQKRNEQRRRGSRNQARRTSAPKAPLSVKGVARNVGKAGRVAGGARTLLSRTPIAFATGVLSEAAMRQFVDPVIARKKESAGERLRKEAEAIDAEFAKVRAAKPPKADPRKTPRAEIKYEDVRRGRATGMQERKARFARAQAKKKK